MSKAMTVRIPEDLRDSILKICRDENIKASNLIRDGLRRVVALHEFTRLRGKVSRSSAKAGFLLDEDIFQNFS